jgi:hypothetical protein
MLNLYLDPEDLISLIAEDEQLSQEQLYFQTNYYKGISNLHKKQESCLALAALSGLTGNYTESFHYLSLFKDFESPLLSYLFHFLSALLKEKLNLFEDSQDLMVQANKNISLIKLKKPFLVELCLFNSYFINRDYKKALSLKLKFQELPENIKQVYFLKKAYCSEVLGLHAKSFKFYMKSSNIESNLKKISNLWEKVLQNKAIPEDFENLLTQSPDPREKNDLTLLFSLFLIKTKNYPKAKQLLEDLNPSDLRPEIYSILSCIYFKTDQIAKSFVFTLKYIKLRPKHADGWVNLSVLYQKTQQNHRFKSLEKARKLLKDEWFSQDFSEFKDMVICEFDLSQFGKDPHASLKAPVKVIEEIFENHLNRVQCFCQSKCLEDGKFEDKLNLNFKSIGLQQGSCYCSFMFENQEKGQNFQKIEDLEKRENRGKSFYKSGTETLFEVPQKRKKKNRRGI